MRRSEKKRGSAGDQRATCDEGDVAPRRSGVRIGAIVDADMRAAVSDASVFCVRFVEARARMQSEKNSRNRRHDADASDCNTENALRVSIARRFFGRQWLIAIVRFPR